MKIELRNISHFKRMSEETNACHADVYVDGVRVGEVKNSGRGEGMYPIMQDRALLKKMEDFCAAMPPEKSPYGDIVMSLDYFLAKLIEDDLIKQEAAYYFKNNVCVREGDKTLLLKVPKGVDVKAYAESFASKLKPGQVILKSVQEVYESLKIQLA